MGPGYNLTMKGGSIGRQDCGGTYQSTFRPAIIQLPDVPPNAQVKFIGPQMINLCNKIVFYPGQFINDGGRGLTMVSWTIRAMAPDVPSVRAKILQIFATAQANKNPKIEIPPLTLSEYGTYVFRYNFTNFLGTMFFNDYTLQTTTYESPYVEIQQLAPFNFATSSRIQLTGVILHQSCVSGTVVLIEDEVKYSWTQSSQPVPDVAENNILSATTSLSGVKASNITYLSINIPPFSGYGGYDYLITLTATLTNKPISANYTVEVSLITLPIQAGIAGGNRMNGFSVPLYLNGWAQDPNIQFNQSQGIIPVWSCINLNTNAECRDGNDNKLTYNLSQYNQTIRAKSLLAYNAYNFYLNVSKPSLGQYAVAQAVIVIVELDLPVLVMNSPAYATTSKVNLNMDMKFTLVYPVNNPDAVFYGGALVYDYDVVQTMKFQFTNFSITLWNLFDNFTNVTQITFRASVYDPRFFMPSTNSITLLLNLPPKNCKLSVEPSFGISFNQKFQATVSDCTDPDSPLTYKFGYYYSPEHYDKDIIGAKTLNYNLLVDFSVDNILTTILPQPLSITTDTENPYILLIVTVSDALGGIKNLTSKIVTGSNQAALEYNIKVSQTSTTRLLEESEKNITKKLEQRTRIPRYYRIRQTGEVQDQIAALTSLYNDMGGLSVYEKINMLNLLATGSGGIPIPVPSSYVNDDDKAQAKIDANNLLTLKLNILQELKSYQTQDVSQPTKESIIKSISFLNAQPDVQGTYTSTDIYNQLVTIDQLIQTCSDQLDQINSDIESGRVDSTSFRLKQSLNNNLDRSLALIDNVLVAQHDSISTLLAELASQTTTTTDETTTNSTTTDNSTTTNTTNTTTTTNSTTTSNSSLELEAARKNNVYMLTLINEFKSVVVRAFNPNGPPATFGGTGFSLKTTKATPSVIAQYFGGLDLTKEAASTKLSVDDEAAATETDEVVLPFTLLQFQFESNPYATDSDYPNPDSKQPVQGVELAYPNGTIFVPKQPLPLNYDVQTATTTARRQLQRLEQRTSRHHDERHNRNLQFIQDMYAIDKPPDFETTSCTSKVGGAWKSNACQLIQQEQAGVLQITCKCDKLQPTSLGSTIGDALQLDKFGKAFSAAALLALLNFPFFKSVLVYAIVLMTTALVICVYYGMKKDFIEAQSKILPVHFVESEYIRITAEQEMEKRQAIIDRDIQREKEKLEREQARQKKSTESQDLQIPGSSQDKQSSTEPINMDIEVQEVPPIEPIEVRPDIDPDELYAIMQANKPVEQILESDSEGSSSDSEDSYEYVQPCQQQIYGQPDQEENIILRKQDEYDLYFDSNVTVQNKSKSSILDPRQHQIKVNVQHQDHQAIQIDRQEEEQPFKQEIKEEQQEQQQEQQEQQVQGRSSQEKVQVPNEVLGQDELQLQPPPDFDQSEIPVVRRLKSQVGFDEGHSNQYEAYEQPPIVNQFGSELSGIPKNEDEQQERGSQEQLDMLGSDNAEPSPDPMEQQQEAQPNELEIREKQIKKRKKKSKKKNYEIDGDVYDEEKEPLYEIKEQMVKDYIRRKKREAFEKSNKQIEFNLRNIIIFFCLFHRLLAIFFLFERKLPRAIRFCVLYMTILNTCYINIFFQVPLDPVQSIIFSIASAILSAIEMFVITFLMPHKFICLRMLGWIMFIGITLLLIWFILTSMALEAADSNGDVSRSNAWGINFILGFLNTHLVSDPVKLVIMFKALQVSLNAAQGPIQKILVMAFVNAGSNLFFEEIH